MDELLTQGFGLFGIVLAFVIIVFAIFLPLFVFEAQRYANQCAKELRKLNKNIEAFLEIQRR